jgi:serine/threonine-protein kinase
MPETPMAVILTVVKGPQAGRVIEFAEPRGFIIGRGTDADLRLPQDDPYVSRRHAFLEVCPPVCRLRNLSVTNPLHVIGQEADECELGDGDVIEVGYTQLKVTIRAAGPGEPYRCPRCGAETQLLAGEQAPSKCIGCQEAEAQKRAGQPRKVLQVACSCCETDLTERANSDGRAEEFREVATYLCDACCEAHLPRAEDGAVSAGPYEVRDRLGEGGMGIVSRAYHRQTARVWVVKHIKDVRESLLAKRFEREVRLLRGLTHRNIVRCVDTGLDDSGMPFVTMEYVAGGSLDDLMRTLKRPLQPAEAIPLICQVLDGLAYIHGKSIIHRDIKPQNILVGPHQGSGRLGDHIAKLVDFGLAVSYARAGGTRLTKAGSRLGTLMFMPPEQIHDAANVREPADTYAVGVTLYYLLTGHYSFNFPTPAETLAFQQQNRDRWNRPEEAIRALMHLHRIMHPFHIILEDTPIPIRQRNPNIPESLAVVVDRAVQKEIHKRFHSAGYLRETLQGLH